MLLKLYIRNYAIIHELSVAFHPGFNSITGETGAGKSILAGALGLAMGNRADTAALRVADQKCIVEAVFENTVSKEIKQFFLEEDIDEDQSITLRREIAANGKSRSFINDTPVNLAQVKGVCVLLLDMHQQFDTLELGNDYFQRTVIDSLANHAELLQQYQQIFKQYSAEQKEVETLKAKHQTANKEYDYQQFLYNELQEAQLQPNELETLELELAELNNSENTKATLEAAIHILKEGELPLVQQLKVIVQQLQHLKTSNAAITLLKDRLSSTQIELADIANDVETIYNQLNHHPARLEAINDRLNTGNKLLKKHNVQTTDELLQVQAALLSKLKNVVDLHEAIESKENLVAALQTKALQTASLITENRKKIAPAFETKMTQLLKQVGMPNAFLQVQLNPGPLQLHGADEISFLFDANKSGRYEPIHKVASGGELSRLMLCIKYIVAGTMQLPTLVFDEIDSGISGEAARQVGMMMQGLAKQHQVISITHQPQVAAKADAHFFVYKKEINGNIQTHIKQLNIDERVGAIANMLGGNNPSATVLQNAREMLQP